MNRSAGKGGELTNVFHFLVPAATTVDTKDEETIQRGLDTYPEEKDPNNRQGGAAIGGGSSGGAAEKGNEVLIMNAKNDDRTTSFFSQPGILAGKKRWIEEWLLSSDGDNCGGN